MLVIAKNLKEDFSESSTYIVFYDFFKAVSLESFENSLKSSVTEKWVPHLETGQEGWTIGFLELHCEKTCELHASSYANYVRAEAKVMFEQDKVVHW